MSAAKDLFLKDKELAERLRDVAHKDWFKRSIAFAKAELLDAPGLNADKLSGAKEFERILLTLADEPIESPMDFPVSGISHNLDISTHREKIEKKE